MLPDVVTGKSLFFFLQPNSQHGSHRKNDQRERERMKLLILNLLSEFCDGLEGWMGVRGVQEGEDICIHIADSLHCTADINTTV